MPDSSGYPSRPYAWTVVAILIATAVLSYTDRQVLSLLVDPIRADLGISDTQISLLLGTAFAVVYGVAGLPLGYLADRTSRRNLIFAGVLVWSIGTLACGLSQSFGHRRQIDEQIREEGDDAARSRLLGELREDVRDVGLVVGNRLLQLMDQQFEMVRMRTSGKHLANLRVEGHQPDHVLLRAARAFLDDDLKLLATMTQLESLELNSPLLPDERLPLLQSFAFLKELTIANRPKGYSPETQAKIKALLPKVAVKFVQ